MKKRRYARTKEEYVAAIATSTTIAEVARKLELAPAGGNYQTIKRKAEEFSIDVSHFKNQGWRKGQFLSSHKSTQGNKQRLIRERGHQCQKCSNTEWLGLPITLELEHIDGNNSNNAEENMLLLCPNCHSQTPTWRRAKSSLLGDPKTTTICPACGKNKSYGSKQCSECYSNSKNKPALRIPREKSEYKPKICACGNKITHQAKQCETCYRKSLEKTVWPALEVLVNMLRLSSFVAVGKELKVSDNAVRNRLRNRGIDPKTLEKF